MRHLRSDPDFSRSNFFLPYFHLVLISNSIIFSYMFLLSFNPLFLSLIYPSSDHFIHSFDFIFFSSDLIISNFDFIHRNSNSLVPRTVFYHISSDLDFHSSNSFFSTSFFCHSLL